MIYSQEKTLIFLWGIIAGALLTGFLALLFGALGL